MYLNFLKNEISINFLLKTNVIARNDSTGVEATLARPPPHLAEKSYEVKTGRARRKFGKTAIRQIGAQPL